MLVSVRSFENYKADKIDKLMYSIVENSTQSNDSIIYEICALVYNLNSYIYGAQLYYKIYLYLLSNSYDAEECHLKIGYGLFVDAVDLIESRKSTLCDQLEKAKSISDRNIFYDYIINDGTETVNRQKDKIQFLMDEVIRLEGLYGHASDEFAGTDSDDSSLS